MPLIFAIQLEMKTQIISCSSVCAIQKRNVVICKCIYIYTQLWTHTCKHLHYGSVYEGECLHRDGDEMQRQQNGPSHFAREKESESNEKRGGGVGARGFSSEEGGLSVVAV